MKADDVMREAVKKRAWIAARPMWLSPANRTGEIMRESDEALRWLVERVDGTRIAELEDAWGRASHALGLVDGWLSEQEPTATVLALRSVVQHALST